MNRTGRANRIIWKTVVSVALVGCGGKSPPPAAPVTAEAPAPAPVVEAKPEPPPEPPPPPAPEPPPPPAVVTFTVESEPAGADVYVDDQLVGKTPLQLERPPGTELNVKVMHKGYEDKTAALTVGDGSSQQILQFTMTKAKAAKKRARGVGNIGTVGHGSGTGKGVGRGFILS